MAQIRAIWTSHGILTQSSIFISRAAALAVEWSGVWALLHRCNQVPQERRIPGKTWFPGHPPMRGKWRCLCVWKFGRPRWNAWILQGAYPIELRLSSTLQSRRRSITPQRRFLATAPRLRFTLLHLGTCLNWKWWDDAGYSWKSSEQDLCWAQE